MLSRIVISVAMAAALGLAPVSLSARSCILSSAGEKACQLDCCANKTCCATSPKNTALVAQPVAKSGCGPEVNATCAPVFTVVTPNFAAASEQLAPSNAATCVHSPPQLAALCTFLI